jgi:hypothetical protein
LAGVVLCTVLEPEPWFENVIIEERRGNVTDLVHEHLDGTRPNSAALAVLWVGVTLTLVGLSFLVYGLIRRPRRVPGARSLPERPSIP